MCNNDFLSYLLSVSTLTAYTCKSKKAKLAKCILIPTQDTWVKDPHKNPATSSVLSALPALKHSCQGKEDL